MYLYEKMVIENKEIPIDDGKSLGNFEGLYDNGVILICSVSILKQKFL